MGIFPNQYDNVGAMQGGYRYLGTQAQNVLAPPPTLLERLKEHKARCEAELVRVTRERAEIDEALALFEKNPDVAAVIEKISKLNF